MGKANVAHARRIMPIYSIMALLKEPTSVLLGFILFQFMLSKSSYLFCLCYAMPRALTTEMTAVGMCSPSDDLSYSML
jgi:predicted Na+-dependent transporter